MSDTEITNEEKYSIVHLIMDNKIIFGTILSIFLFFFISMLLISYDINFFNLSFFTEIGLGNTGLFGDSFNVLTSLFTGLAFAGFLASMLVQQKELNQNNKLLKMQQKNLSQNGEILELQQEELVETRKTLEHQKDEFIKMNNLQELQQYKNDVQRDLEYFKNCIDNITTILDTQSLVQIKEDITSNHKSTNLRNVNSDVQEINNIFENHLSVFYKRYREKKIYSYAKEELKKVISYKSFFKILYNIYLLQTLISDVSNTNNNDTLIVLYNKHKDKLLKILNNNEVDDYFLGNNDSGFKLDNLIHEQFKIKE